MNEAAGRKVARRPYAYGQIRGQRARVTAGKYQGTPKNGTCTGRNRIRPAGRYRENSAYDAGQDEQVIRGDTLPGGAAGDGVCRRQRV